MPSTTQGGGGFGSQVPGAELSVIRLLEPLQPRSNGYLMLEAESSETRKEARGSFVIRFNVGDLEGATNYLEQQGVDLVTHHFDWGSIAVFTDPDGNRCELKTSPTQ
jgi:predicted enzyme related to lactoylglutathione lyase